MQSAVKAALVIHRLMKETEGIVFMDEICQNEEKNPVVSKNKVVKKATVHPLSMDSFLDSKTKEGKCKISFKRFEAKLKKNAFRSNGRINITKAK